MLNDTGRDLATVFGAVLAGLVGAAFLIPAQIRQPSAVPTPPAASPPSPTPGPAPAPRPGPDVVLGVANAAPRYQWSLDQAIAAWNTSGAHILLERTSRAEAQIVVTLAPKSACDSDPDILACTQLGHPAGERRTIWIVDQVDRYDEARVLVHELGHILGLTHDTGDGCVAMTPDLWQNCTLAPPGEWRCRLLAAADINRAIRIYGGTPQPVSEPAFCLRSDGS